MTVWGAGPSEVQAGRRLLGHQLDQRLLDGAGIRPGESALELASGFGAICLRLAERVRPAGRTICSDLRPDRVAATSRLVEQAGIADVDVRVLDMARLDLPDASVDGIVCRWGFMFPLPTVTAFAEARRVLRPGRRLALATWADPSRNPWITLVDEALRAAGLPLPADRTAPGQMFSLSNVTRLRALLLEAGLEALEVDEVDLGWEYDDFDAYWAEEALIAGPFEDFLVALPPAELERLQARLRQLLAPYRYGAAGYRVPGIALLAVAGRAHDEPAAT